MRDGPAWTRHLQRCGGIAFLLCVSSQAAPLAAATSATFQVDAKIVPGCEVNGTPSTPSQNLNTMGTLNFGDHSALETGVVTAAFDQTASLTIVCTPSVALTMAVGNGLHATTVRNLEEPQGQRIAYQLYSDPAYNQELLAGQPVPVSFTASSPVVLPVYGRLTLNGNRRPGTYSDTVTVTLTW